MFLYSVLFVCGDLHQCNPSTDWGKTLPTTCAVQLLLNNTEKIEEHISLPWTEIEKYQQLHPAFFYITLKLLS